MSSAWWLRAAGALVLFVASVPACSSTGGLDESGVNAVAACPAYVAAQRERALRCGTLTAAEGSPADEARAIERLTTLCRNEMSAPGNGIDTKSLDACSAALRDAPCTASSTVCDEIFSTPGTLRDGRPCGYDSQCAGAACMRATRDGAALGCGTCAHRVAPGGACGHGTPPCVAGASCRSDGAGSYRCVLLEKLALGQVCFDPERAVGGICVDGECAPGDNTEVRRCSAYAPWTPRPRPTPTYGPKGAACNTSDRLCTRGSCARKFPQASEGTCVDPIEDGGGCFPGSDGTSRDCDVYASCVDRTCQLFDPSRCGG